jgi:hypothetical protein
LSPDAACASADVNPRLSAKQDQDSDPRRTIRTKTDVDAAGGAIVTATGLWDEVFSRCSLLVDVVLLVVLCALHALPVLGSPSKPADDKSKLADSVRGASASGLTIVGILIPLSVVAIQLRGGSGDAGNHLPGAVLIDFFVGDVWLVVSLAFGLYVVFVVAMRGTYEDVGQRQDVKLLFGFQLMFLFVGVFRLVWGLSDLVSSLLPTAH